MRVLFLPLLVLAADFACKKRPVGEDQYTTFYYKQTYCADPWQRGATDSLTLVNVAAYLKAAGLYVADLNIKEDDTAHVCNACLCKTGKTIYVSTFNNEGTKANYRDKGFSQ